MYLVAPLIVWRKQKLPDRYRLEPLEDAEKFFADRDAEYHDSHAEIQRLGFVYQDSGQFINGDTQTYFSVYRSMELGLLCSLVYIKGQPESVTYVEFTQLYDEDTVLNVMNSTVAEVYPKSDLKLTFRYPDIKSIETLLSVTKRLVACYNEDKSKFSYEGDDIFTILESFVNRELDDLIELGYVDSRVVDGYRSLTIKGAYLMSWKILWPVKQLRNSIEIRRAKDALEMC